MLPYKNCSKNKSFCQEVMTETQNIIKDDPDEEK